MKKYIIIFVLLCGITGGFAKGSLWRANIGLDYGVWKPSSLDQYPNQPLKNIDGAEPYIALAFISPLLRSHMMRFSLMQWQQKYLAELDLESVTLRHLSLDLKYVVLPEYKISPYASYGVAAIWSRETPSGATAKQIPLDRAGWGFNLGAGIDFLLHRHTGLGAEYVYSYAVFPKKVGLTDNYSGPKMAIKLFYIF